MRSPTRLTCIAVATAALSAPVAAQVCAGAPAFRVAPVRITGVYYRGADVSGLGAGLTMGTPSPRGVFARVLGTRLIGDEDDMGAGYRTRVKPAYSAEVEAGMQAPLARSVHGRALAACPVAGAGYTNGPEVLHNDPSGAEVEVETHAWSVSAGAWVGAVAFTSGAMQVIPAALVRLRYVNANVEVDGFFPGMPQVDDGPATDTQLGITLATGFAFGSRLLLRPELEIPLSGGDGTRLGLGVSYALARR